MYQTRSIVGFYCFASMSNYIRATRHSRLEKRVRIAADAAEWHIQHGQIVTVAVGDNAVLSNHDGSVCDVAYDCTNERTLLASLVANRDLKLWERSDSRLLRGSRAAEQVTRPNCYKCEFMRKNGRDYWCAATLELPKPQKCTDFAPRLNRPAGERYVRVQAADIWIPKWSERPKGDFAVPKAK